MNFVIHLNFADFVEVIPLGSIVYAIAFTEVRLKENEAVLHLTTEGNTAGGTIHAVRLTIDADGAPDVLAVAGEALIKIKELLTLKGFRWHQGLVLTEGLDGALRHYGNTPTKPSLKLLDEVLAQEKSRQNK